MSRATSRISPRFARRAQWLLIAVLAGLAVATPMAAAAADKMPLPRHRPAWAASLVTRLKPGQTVTWRSHRIGKITSISLVANGVDMTYELKPRTNACVGYAYGEGVAVRLTDCVQGRRVPYVRVRAVNAGVEAARLRLRFGRAARTG